MLDSIPQYVRAALWPVLLVISSDKTNCSVVSAVRDSPNKILISLSGICILFGEETV